MNPLGQMNIIEQTICNKADLNQIPISGSIELLPLCNMDCKMCFAKMTKKEMEKHAPMHNYKEWLEIAKQMSDAGTIFLLLTGGEPFLYPHFKELYLGLKKMGFIVSINTNGTIINEEIAEYLANDPPRRLNITLYGASDETYAKLCNNPKGFTQVMKAINILKEKNIDIKLNCTLTPYNINELDNIYKISKEINIPIETAYYLMPSIRKNNIENKKYRLNPKEAAKAKIHIKELLYDKHIFKEYLIGTLQKYYDFKDKKKEYKPGYTCRAGNSVFWIDYDGKMKACSFTKDISLNVFEDKFSVLWKKLVKNVSSTYLSKECNECSMRVLCTRCAASAYSENGDYNNSIQYHCELTKEFIRLLEDKAKELKIYEDK